MKSGMGSLSFMDSPVYERFAALTNETFEDLSGRTGVPLNLLMLIREATGGAVPNPTDRVREDELAVVPWIETELRMGFRPVSVERTLRVLGDSMRRVATTESTAWRTDLMDPMVARGGTSLDLANASSSADTELLGEVGDTALLAIWHAQQAQAVGGQHHWWFRAGAHRCRPAEVGVAPSGDLLPGHHGLHPAHRRTW